MRTLTALLWLALAAPSAALASADVWTAVGPVSAPVVAVRISPSAPSRLYAGITNYGIFRSEDAGRSWAAANTGLTDLRLLNLAIDPGSPSTLYASTGFELGGSPDHGGIFRSKDGGSTWERLPGSPGDAAALAVLQGRPATVLAGYFGGVFQSTDEGATWRPTFSYGVHTLAPDPTRPETVYLGGLGTFESLGDVLVSTNRGASWRPLSFPRDSTIGALAIAPFDVPVVYAGKFSSGGVWRSAGGGTTWRPASEGLASRSVLSLAVDPLRPSVVYAGTVAGVYRSIDGGNRWTPFKSGLTNEAVTSLAIDPSGRRLYAGTSAGGVYALDVCEGPECGPASAAVRVVPLVSDGPGAHGGRTTTEVTLLNGGTSPATARLELPALSPAAPTSAVPLEPGRQVTIPDLGRYLRDRGLSLPGDRAWEAVLRVTFTGLSPSAPVAVLARSLSTGPFGPTVTGIWGVEPDPALSPIRVFGLRETAAERSEIVVVNTRSDGDAHLVVGVDDAAGDPALPPTAVTLGPGGVARFQTGLPIGSSGFAAVTGSSGDEFFAFGLVTDRATESASYMPGTPSGADDLIAPALVETDRYVTELVLAATRSSASSLPVRLDTEFRDSLNPAGASRTHALSLTSVGGNVIPSAVEWLRENGFDLGPPGGSHAGVLLASPAFGGLFTEGSLDDRSRTFAAARVLTRNASGPGWYTTGFLTKTERAAEGIVPGLVQDENTRTNLAIMNPGAEGIRVRVQIVDESGSAFPESDDAVLGPGEWRQIGSALAPFGAKRGWARIRSITAPGASPSPFFAYAVVNDGPSPGTGTGGGSYVPMNPR